MTDDAREPRREGIEVPAPPGRGPGVELLEPLVGEWVLGNPTSPVGKVTFSWLEGRHFLVERWTVAVPGAPDGIAVLGEAEDGSGLVRHYFDSRGVARVYRTSMEEDGTWKLWREAQGFHQRFTGTLNADGTTIAGTWEHSPDGATWNHDFDLAYTKVR